MSYLLSTHTHHSETFGAKLARLCRQILFIPYLYNRWMTAAVKTNLTHAIQYAEQGHRGEIVLVIENTLPIHRAFAHNSQSRAIELFATQGVWDTAENTGILIYLNLCEKDLHIIADRGICQKTLGETWIQLCDEALSYCQNGAFEHGLINLITQLGVLLGEHFPANDLNSNELPNHPIYLR